MQRRQGVIWMLTIPHLSWTPVLPDGIMWMRGQAETGVGGFAHWQIVAHFASKQSLAGVKRSFPIEAHCELTRSEAANTYVWKEETRIAGTQFEFGIKPVVRSSKVDWERVWQAAVEGRLESIPANVRVQSYNSLRKIRADYATPLAIQRTCVVYHGATGTGKSRRAWDEAGMDAYPKAPSTKFWCGYRGQKSVVIDEFRGEIGIGHLLRWLDRYPVLVEIKGSAVVLEATRIWITSNLPPSEWYPDLDSLTKEALMRRLDVVHFRNLINT